MNTARDTGAVSVDGYAQTPGARAPERRTSSVELLWDLVFVFAVTQVTSSLVGHISWLGLGRAALLLALIWWAWSAFVWTANAQEPDSSAGRAALFLAMALIFLAGIALPHAYGSDGPLFAGTYAGVRFLHLGVYADASRRGNAKWSAISGFAVTVAIGMAVLIVGSTLAPTPRTVLWAVAVAIDYAGPAWLTRERLRGLQRVAVAHFAERYGLFVIICIGESIAAIGVAATRQRIDGAVVGAAIPALAITVGLWWSYFHRVAAAAEERLRVASDPVLAGSDGYSYLHLPVIAGIVVFAVGARASVVHASTPLSTGARLCLCCGVALYLAAHAAFQRRLLGRWPLAQLLCAAALVLIGVALGGTRAWLAESATAALLVALCAVAAVRADSDSDRPGAGATPLEA